MTELLNIAELYRSYCVEEECRANSAVLRYIEDRGVMHHLEQLVLSSNYLGPRGLRPIIRLVDYCQTLTHLDLAGNGADNATVEALCVVLERHTGLQSLSLRGNPITVVGGKHVLALVEHNPHIFYVDLTDTDVFFAVVCKVDTVTAANRERAAHDAPQLEMAPEVDDTHSARGRNGSVSRQPGERPTLTPLPPVAVPNSQHAHMSAAMISTTGGGGVYATPRASPSSRHNGGAMRRTAPAITRPQPRPPIPALASMDARRLPDVQREELRRRYRAKALLFREINERQASHNADRARRELMLLEQSTQPKRGGDDRRNKDDARGGAMRATAPAMICPENEGNLDADHSPPAAPATIPTSTEGENDTTTAASGGVGGAAVTGEGETQAEDTQRLGVLLVQREMDSAGELFPDPRGASTQQLASIPLETTTSQTATDEDPRNGSQWISLDSTTQFQQLFDTGCRAYAHQDLDAAYIAWTEAMDIAVRKKNREWMAVLSSNLQRLAFELLVREGVDHLENDRLEEADESFQRARDVAVKARNATWESDMHRARKDVQHAVFQRCHKSALKLFERAQRLPAQEVTEDDYYIFPGTDVMIQHTEAYVNEWSRMLLVKEAVETWAASRRVVERIGGSASKVLMHVIEEAMDTVASFLVKRSFETEDPHALSWMRTSHYSYQECIMLCSLWTDMVSCDKFATYHKPFAAVAAAQIGNFYLSTNQLSQAHSQFQTLETLASVLDDPLLRATGLTFSALVNWQRARYSVAEGQLRAAVLEWGELRELAQVLSSTPGTEGTHGNAQDNPNQTTARGFVTASSPTGAIAETETGDVVKANTTTTETTGAGEREENPKRPTSRLLAAVPVGFLTTMEVASFRYLVSSIASTYRYSEALEVLERSLVCKHRDLLFEKLKVNFNAQPTLDHIVAISTQCRSPFLYYLAVQRYDWLNEERRYAVDEKLLMWVVPQSNEMRFVEVSVTKDFKVPSIMSLVETARRGMLLDPLDSCATATNEIITTFPKRSWVDPLQALYGIFVDPVVEFLRALDPVFLTKNGVITVIPTEQIWLVPFNALIARNGNYLIEDFAVQLAFCATQCAFSALCARRVEQRDLHRDVVLVQRETDPPSRQLLSRVVFPFDAVRSVQEGEAILNTISHFKRDVRTSTRKPDSGTVFTSSEVLIDDMDSLRDVLPRCRTLYVATSTTSGTSNEESSAGAICIAVSREEAALMRASEIARAELFAEFVVMSNTNMSTSRVVGAQDDVQGLLRGFFSGGVPCVITGLWCTPDMVPSELFRKFYQLLSEANKNQRAASASGGRLPHAVDVSPGSEMGGGETTEVHSHKAIVLASSIRALLEETFFRYSPRCWAGYSCIGHGASQ